MCGEVCGRATWGPSEARALRVGIAIEDVPGIIKPLTFAVPGHDPVIYLPAGWSGPIREQAIVKMVEVLAMRHVGEECIVAVWAGVADAARGQGVGALAGVV